MRRITLQKGFLAKVWGPARIVVERGCVLLSGSELCESQEALVGSERGVSVYALEGPAELVVNLGSGASLDVLKADENFVRSWITAIEDLKHRGFKRIVVVGPPESGKSTFATWLLNSLKSWVVEADIGQNELGLPAMVAAAKHPGGLVVTLQDLADHSVGWFVGHVSAEQAGVNLLAAATRASKLASAFVMDTDGYVKGVGVLHKQALVQAVNADVVVCMGCSLARELRGVVEEVVCVPETPHHLIRERDRADRKSFRERQYARLFADSKTLRLEGLDLINVCATSPVDPDALRTLEAELRLKAFDAWMCNDDVVVVTPKPVRASDIICLSRDWSKGLVCGLRLAEYDVPCLLEDLKVSESRIVVRVPRRFEKEAKSARALVLGYIRLDENFHEVEKYAVGLYPLTLARTRGGPRRTQRL